MTRGVVVQITTNATRARSPSSQRCCRLLGRTGVGGCSSAGGLGSGPCLILTGTAGACSRWESPGRADAGCQSGSANCISMSWLLIAGSLLSLESRPLQGDKQTDMSCYLLYEQAKTRVAKALHTQSPISRTLYAKPARGTWLSRLQLVRCICCVLQVYYLIVPSISAQIVVFL